MDRSHVQQRHPLEDDVVDVKSCKQPLVLRTMQGKIPFKASDPRVANV